VLDILYEVGILGSRAVNAPMKTNIKLLLDRVILAGIWRLVGKLNYLNITGLDIAFAVSESVSLSTEDHLLGCSSTDSQNLKKTPGKELIYSDYGQNRFTSFLNADWARSPVDKQSTTCFCIFFGENLVP